MRRILSRGRAAHEAWADCWWARGSDRAVGAGIRQAVPMAEDVARQVTLVRVGLGRYEVRNVRGGSITIGSGGDEDFTPVELLLAALGGCTAIDVDLITARRAEPESFQVIVTGD